MPPYFSEMVEDHWNSVLMKAQVEADTQEHHQEVDVCSSAAFLLSGSSLQPESE
jgi:hypothetical protein